MASGDTGNVVPGNRLRVRVPCPPLIQKPRKPNDLRGFFVSRIRHFAGLL